MSACRYLLHTVSSVVQTSISHIKTTSLTLCWPPPIKSSLTCWGMDILRTAPPGSWCQNVSSTSFDVSELWVGPARDLGGLEANSSPQTGCFAPQAIPEPSFSLHDWVQGLHQQEVQRVNVTSTSTATGLPLMHDSSDQTPLFHCTVGLFWCSCPPPASWTTVAPVLDLITLVSLTSVASSPAHSRDREHLSTTMSSWRTKMSICANYVSKYQSSSIPTHYNGIWRSILEKSLKKAGMMKQAVTFNDCLTGGKTDRMMFFSSCQRPEIE